MATVATITADFRANAVQFLTELKRVNQESKATATTLQRDLASAMRTVASVASIGAFTAFIRSAANAADALAKTADRLGVTTQQLQAMQYAARGAGADVESLNKALTEAQKRLAEASATGKGDTADWIGRLGLQISALRAQNPAQLFSTYADAIGKLSNAGDRFAATQALMGRGSEALINLFRGGSSGIQQAAADIQAMGIELSRVDAAKVEQANDQLERLGFVARGVGQQLAIALAPYVEGFVRSLIDTQKTTDGLKSNFATFARVTAVAFQIMGQAADAFDYTISHVAYSVAGLVRIVAGLYTQGALLERIGAGFDKLFGNSELHQKEVAQNQAVVDLMTAVMENAKARMDAAGGRVLSLQQILDRADGMLAEANARAQAAAAAAGGGGGTPPVPGAPIIDPKEMNTALQDAYKAIEKATAESQDMLYQLVRDGLDRTIQAQQDAAAERVSIEAQANEAIYAQREMVTNLSVGLLQALGQKHKAFALIALAIEKVQTIQRILMANQIAAWLAYASQLIPGDPTSLIRANAAYAAVRAQGALSVALVAATGLVEAGNILSGNSQGSSTANPVFTRSSDSTSAAAGGASGATQGRVVNIYLQGPIAGPDSARWLIDQFRDAINQTDTIIISANSAQAQLIREG